MAAVLRIVPKARSAAARRRRSNVGRFRVPLIAISNCRFCACPSRTCPTWVIVLRKNNAEEMKGGTPVIFGKKRGGRLQRYTNGSRSATSKSHTVSANYDLDDGRLTKSVLSGSFGAGRSLYRGHHERDI